MLNKIKKNNEGFTIIEVLIVLAIAGLIILIVLLAIPALQRNSRNTAIKSDAGAIAGGVSDFAATNDGAIPTKGGSSQDVTTPSNIHLNNASGTEVIAKVQGGTKVNFGTDATGATVTAAAGELTVTFGTKCSAVNGTDKYDIIKSTRSASVVYAQETSGSAITPKCLDS